MYAERRYFFFTANLLTVYLAPLTVPCFALITAQRNTVIYPGKQVTELIKITTGQDVLRPGTE